MDVSKQYFQIYTKNPLAQCILYRESSKDPLMAYEHRGMLMGWVFSSFIANSSTIQAGTIFDEMMDKVRRGELDLAQIYGPLAKAIGKDGLLNPSKLP